MSELKKLGDNIRRARERKNLTQLEMASKSKINASYYAKIERGEVNTSYKKLYQIQKTLKAKTSEIFPD